MKRIYLFLLFLPLQLFSQNEWCSARLGSLDASEQASAREFYNKNRDLSLRSNTVDSVAVTIHMASDLAISFEQIEQELAIANSIFRDSGIRFYVCGSPREFSSGSVSDFSLARELNNEFHVPNTINIYFVNEILFSTGDGACGFASFPFFGTPRSRFVFMAGTCATNGSVLIHELGHFYGLLHTHETGTGTEFVDRSNCRSSGDYFCDTEADPNLSRPGLLNNCLYVGNITDPNGDRYTPPVNNFMSYSPSFCQQLFSTEQLAFIRAVHEDENSYLDERCAFNIDFAVDSDLEVLNINSFSSISAEYRINSKEVKEPVDVNFQVILFDNPEQTIGIKLYEQEMRLLPDQEEQILQLTLDIPVSKTSGTYYLVAQIDSDQAIIERTEKNNVFEIEVNIDNSQLQDLVVFPNPAKDQAFLFYRDNNTRGLFTLRIFRYDGVEVFSESGFKSRDEVLRAVDVSRFPPGFYTAFLNFDKINFSQNFKFIKQ